MAEYIEREAVQRKVLGLTIAHPMVKQYADAALWNIQRIPAADVVEVRYGVWKEKGGDIFCSVCGIDNDAHGVERFNYCPNCGADMRGDNNERKTRTQETAQPTA